MILRRVGDWKQIDRCWMRSGDNRRETWKLLAKGGVFWEPMANDSLSIYPISQEQFHMKRAKATWQSQLKVGSFLAKLLAEIIPDLQSGL